MAITIETDFEDYNPVYNTLEVAVSSTNSSNTGFKYVFDVTVEGETTKQFKVTPEPSQSFGVIDLHNFLETFVKAEFGDFSSITCFELSEETIRKFSVLYQEEWLVTGLPVIGDDNLQGGDKYIWEASLEHHDWIDQRLNANPFNKWICNVTNGTSGEWLTTQKTKRVRLTDYGWQWFMSDTPNDCKKLEIKTYDGLDASGSLLGTFRINNLNVTTGTAPRLQRVMSSPGNINTVDNADFDTGSQPVFDSTVKSYTIQLVNTANTAASEILTFNLEEDCRYEVFRLHFENVLGGYDAYNFKFRNQRSETFERATYMSDPYRVTASGLDYKHEQVQSITHYVKSNKKIKLRSDYLTDAENNWLKQLKKSTSIFLEFTDGNGNTNFKPVKMIEGDWLEKVNAIDKLFNIEFDITMSWNDYSQRK